MFAGHAHTQGHNGGWAMHPHHLIFLIPLATFLVIFTPNSRAADQIAQPDKALVLDGHVVHNLGHLSNHVSNFGLIGSQPTATSSFNTAPSARWPDPNGDDYL